MDKDILLTTSFEVAGPVVRLCNAKTEFSRPGIPGYIELWYARVDALGEEIPDLGGICVTLEGAEYDEFMALLLTDPPPGTTRRQGILTMMNSFVISKGYIVGTIINE